MKWICFYIALFSLLFISGCSGGENPNITGPVAQCSIGIGSIIAIMASWTRNQSVLWAVLHAFLGWFYVIYYVLTRR